MPAWILNTLGANGLAGVFIFVLLIAITALWRSNVAKDKRLSELNEERATEREQFVKLVEGGNAAASATASATEKRNDIIDDLAKAITTQANSVERYNDSVKNRTETLVEKFSEFKHVVDAFGESNRVSSGFLSDIRTAMTSVQSSLNQLTIAVTAATRGN